MGAVPYSYIVEYQPDINAALQKLREQEFQAGRYNPVIPFPFTTFMEESSPPGSAHRSINEATRASGADGTRSILDLGRVSPTASPGAVFRLPDGVLMRFFGTTRPTREMVEQGSQSELLERGQGCYIILYRDGEPDEILFAGLSYD